MGTRNSGHGDGMWNIATKQDVLGVGTCTDSVVEFLLQASRSNYDQTSRRELLPDLSQNFNLQKKIIFWFQQPHRNQCRIVLAEKGSERLWKTRSQLLRGQKRMRVD